MLRQSLSEKALKVLKDRYFVVEDTEKCLEEKPEMYDVLIEDEKNLLQELKNFHQKAYANLAIKEYSRENPVDALAKKYGKKTSWLYRALNKYTPDWQRYKYRNLNYEKIIEYLKSGIAFRIVAEINHVSPYILFAQLYAYLKGPEQNMPVRRIQYWRPSNAFEEDIVQECRWIDYCKIYNYNELKIYFKRDEDYIGLRKYTLYLDDNHEYIRGNIIKDYLLSFKEHE